jgi:hypothetical protein
LNGDSIGDIIRKESDRLFMVDRECYIIFTGTSLEDDRPFIRIGNYIDLPVEIIPLIENIVITDLLVGNPACEQFNIDIKQLPSNRYIGSRRVVSKYLGFQKIFGLDLTNATIVDVEKDIPYLSRQKELSARDSFIGIFYTNGNFKINHRESNIMDLLKETGAALDEAKVLGLVSAAARDSKRYAGDGAVFIGGNPLFYKNRHFTCYHFPKRFIEEFAALSIDPARIREAIHPSSNFIHVTRLIKWKHGSGGRLRVFSGHREQMEQVRNLFPGASITHRDFNGFAHDTDDGLSVRNYPGTFNIRLTWGAVKPERLDLSLSYIKGGRGLEQILTERQDGLLVHYSVYEEATLLIKSSHLPVLIVADSGLSKGRLKGHALPVLYSGVQYDFRKFGKLEALLSDAMTRVEGAPALAASAAGEIEEKHRAIAGALGEGHGSSLDGFSEAFNTLSLFRVMLESEKDRKRAAALRKAVQEIDLALERGAIASFDPGAFRVIICFCGPMACEFIEKLDGARAANTAITEEITGDDAQGIPPEAGTVGEKFRSRVLEDRRRLMKLLELYRPRSEKAGLRELEKAMAQRKEEFYIDEPSLEEESAPGAGRTPSWKRAAAWAAVLLALAVSALLYTDHARTWSEERARAAALREELARKELIARYKIVIAPYDIFMYANEVALKNGYKRITFSGFKDKNPNWIYPGNRFNLDDNETVTVKEGDTLWDIAGTRLLEKNVRFYRAIDSIREMKSGGEGYVEGLALAEKLAFSAEHREILAGLRGKGTDGTKGQDKLLPGTR